MSEVGEVDRVVMGIWGLEPCNHPLVIVVIQSNLVNTTLIYTTSVILRHIFARPKILVQNSLIYTSTTLDNETFRIFVLSH